MTRILTIGREQAIELAGRFDGVWAVVGWHPHEAAEADVEALRPLLAASAGGRAGRVRPRLLP